LRLAVAIGVPGLKGQKPGPVFVTEREARVQLPAADLDEHGHARLSYQHAAALFTKASGGANRRADDGNPEEGLKGRPEDVR
jgi:hypothetical protein